MGFRRFVDENAVAWDVWDVNPIHAERRLRERRAMNQPITHLDRRAVEDRRTDIDPRNELPPELTRGWLTFHSSGERRRYWPVPLGWEDAGDAELSRLCRAARLVGRGDAVAEDAAHPPTAPDFTPPYGLTSHS